MENYRNSFVQSILAYAVQRDINALQLCESAGIDYKSLQKDIPVNDTQLNSLWKNAAHLTADPLFGYHFGESAQLAALGIIGHIIQASNTVGDALAKGSAFVELITDMFTVTTKHDDSSFTLELCADRKKVQEYPYTYRHMGGYLMMFVIHEMNGLLLEKIKPLKVQLPELPESTKEYERMFRCSTIEKGNHYLLSFSSSILEIPVLSANYSLQQMLLQKLSIVLPQKGTSALWQNKIYHHLLANSYLHTLSLEDVAANFNTSARSLQRKLKDEGITYLEIVDSVKKNLAINYLENGNHQIKDIAYTLGYNGQSAFNKAFKRWTGESPSAYTTNKKNSL